MIIDNRDTTGEYHQLGGGNVKAEIRGGTIVFTQAVPVDVPAGYEFSFGVSAECVLDLFREYAESIEAAGDSE